MKGLSVKKIVALAAGAAVLGASLAAADVMFGSTPVVNQNGQPVVKVVVGAKAAASDGVVAANIAAVIGNKAYSKKALSATLSGTATCTTTTTGAGAGSCPVSNKKVTLEVTLPGVISGSANFKTYINDYVDKYTLDRTASPSGVGNNYSTTTEIKPCFTGSYTTGNVVAASACEVPDPSTGAKHGRKVTGGEFPALATATVRDTYAGKSYTEEQSIWVSGNTVYDETGKTVVADTPNVAYKVDFTHDLYGLPEYSSSNYNSVTSPLTELTERHRVGVKFLGEDWIISDISPPSGMASFNPSSYVAYTASGASLSLAKESAYGIVHIGENLTSGAYTVKLADIGLATGTGNVHSAAIEIYDANGVLVKEDQVDPGSTYSWTAPDGTKLKLHLYQTQPGYTLASKWAEMAVYANELTLTHASKLDNVDNPLWYPYLYWSNNPNNNNVTTLKTVILSRSATDPSTVLLKLQKGDSIPVITTPSKFQMTFDGVNLGSADYDGLAFTITGATTLAYNDSASCTATSSTASTNFLQITSGITNAFTVSGSPISNFYVDLGGINASNGTYVYYQQSGMNCFFRTAIAAGSTLATYNLGDGVTQDLVALYTYGGNGTVAVGSGNFTLYLDERASSTTNDKDRWLLEIDNSSDSAWAFTGSATQSKIKYRLAVATGPVGTSTAYKAVDPGYTSERGSVFSSLSSKSTVLKVAKKIAEATYFISTVGAATSGATTITLAEGESQTLAGGVVIKAKKIDETVGACTATGGAGSCKVDMAPVSAVLNTGDASANVITSYPVTGDLVVLDNSNPSAAVLIAVGGPMVNEVTKQALASAPSVLSKPGDVYVKEAGNTIVVAGYSAADTIEAGKQFIAGLQ